MTSLPQLLIGAIRDAKLFRKNSAGSGAADAEYKARRPAVMAKGQYRCVFCGHMSQKFNECHHIDGNHANNDESNMVVVDTLCHAYNHLGQHGSQEQFASDNLGKDKTVVAAIPEISAADLNLLQRAIGAALLDGTEAPIAEQIIARLSERAVPVRDAFGTFDTGDFGAALSRLDNEAYGHRGSVVGGLRLLFRMDVLRHEGVRFTKDFPALPASTWGDIEKNATSKSTAR